VGQRTQQELQEAAYGEGTDYRVGSPHLSHWPLYDLLVGQLRRTVRSLADSGLPLTVLEVGAGHGGFTEPALAAGCEVTAVEMSRPSLQHLQERFGTNPRFQGRFDPDGSLAAVGGCTFSLVLCVSVLHHIPDYLAFLELVVPKIREDGVFLSLQHPLWYPRMGSFAHQFDRAGYLAWRAGRGDYAQGLRTLGRRIRKVYDQARPEDMVEYHVVRQGVDEQAILARLAPRFERARILPYWSNQSAAGQRIGTRLGLKNMFAAIAQHRLSDDRAGLD
jgi:SAM-dependent methyltransferase